MKLLNDFDRNDMIDRAYLYLTVCTSGYPDASWREMAKHDRQCRNSVELRKLYFETIQYVNYLGNCPDDELTEHDAEVEHPHPLYTKHVWEKLRRNNEVVIGYWEWVFENAWPK